MEFDLESLKRDWISGISGEAFFGKLHATANILSALSDEERRRGLLLAEADPIEFAAGFFGAVLTQTPVILANPDWGAQEWAQLGGLVQPRVEFCRGVTCDTRRSVGLASTGVTSDAPTFLQPATILIPTGGTTGGVKLAIHTWASFTAACRGVQAFLGGEPINSCCVLPLYHVSGLMQLVRSFVSGGRIRFDDTDMAGNCLSLVPTQLQRLLSDPASIQKLKKARAIFVGGAAMPAAVAETARERQLPIIPVYGMTETAAMCAAVPTADFHKDASAGAVPIGDTRFLIESDDGRLRIQSSALFQGYQGRPLIDREAGYLTDDVVRLATDGRLHVLGRIDRLINSGGEKIDPREVEAALLQIKGIAEAHVFGEPDPEWGQIVVAHLHGTQEIEVEKIRTQLKAKLSPYKIPKRFQWMETDQYVGA